MSLSRESLRQKFNTVNFRRQYEVIKVSKEMMDLFGFMDGSIRDDLKAFSIMTLCGGDRKKYPVEEGFARAWNTLTTQEKLVYYECAVDSVIQHGKGNTLTIFDQLKLTYTSTSNDSIPITIIKGLKPTGLYTIHVPSQQIRHQTISITQLNKYILRKSKKSSSYYLQNIGAKESNIKFEAQKQVQRIMMAVFQSLILAIAKVEINSKNTKSESNPPKMQLSKDQAETANINPNQNIKLAKVPTVTYINSVHHNHAHNNQTNNNSQTHNKSILFQLIKDTDEQQLQQDILQTLEKQEELARMKQTNLQKQEYEYIKSTPYKPKAIYRQSILTVLLPHYNFQQLQNMREYLPVNATGIQIYQHAQSPCNFKIQLTIPYECRVVLAYLLDFPLAKMWNQQILECCTKMYIPSQNSAIQYMQCKKLSDWYRERDFIFVRHLCKINQEQKWLIVDKSIQSTNWIPFQGVQRGRIPMSVLEVTGKEKHTHLIMQIVIEHGGLMNVRNTKDLTLRYLSQFANLQKFISKGLKTSHKYDIDWTIYQIPTGGIPTPKIQPLCNSALSISSSRFGNMEENEVNLNNQSMQSMEFYTIQDENEEKDDISEHQLSLDEIQLKKRKTESIMSVNQKQQQQPTQRSNKIFQVDILEKENRMIDDKGYCVLPLSYLHAKHSMKPLASNGLKKIMDYSHVMFKNDFVLASCGGMLLTNKVKIKQQNNVISYVMSTLKKNLFSGKGILNISLPVQIFAGDSNIQRLCEAMSMAPTIIPKALKADPIERFKHCIAFGLSNSILYFDIQKVFNPILGETFQGWIDGCPVYAEQISHHPPISSILMYGRGYRIHANIQAKVYIHLNSGEGVNEGFYKVEFDDGGCVQFQTAPGEVSGLVMGDRMYHIKGKMWVIDRKNRLFSSVSFQDQNGIFSGNRWKTDDQMEGDICTVTQSFIDKFISAKDKSKPSKKQIEQVHGYVSGRWLNDIYISGKDKSNAISYYSIQKDIPFAMIHDPHPLNSNSEYREDLIYRQKGDLVRSQIEKERLQIKQREDKKKRQKYGKSSH